MNPTRWAKVPVVCVLLVLLASQLLTDRIGPLQFLWWTPRVMLVSAAIAGFAVLLAIARNRRWPAVEQRRLAVWLGASAILGLACTWSDWGLPRARPEGAFRLAHWNICNPTRADAPPSVDTMLTFEADAILLTDVGLAFAEGGAERMAASGYAIARAGPFAIASRAPIVEARPVYAARGRALSRFVLATPQGPLAIDAVDLPSETTMHRSSSVRAFVATLEEIGHLGNDRVRADLLVGDFNITRGSASLAQLAPDATEAFADAGTGWGGTYPRAWPYWAIDQTLVRAPWRALRSEIVDPGRSRHRAQLVDLVRVGSGG